MRIIRIVLMFLFVQVVVVWAQSDLIPGQTRAPDTLILLVRASLYNKLNSIPGLDDEVRVVDLELIFQGGPMEKDGSYDQEWWGGEATLSYFFQGHKIHVQVTKSKDGFVSWRIGDPWELNFLR